MEEIWREVRADPLWIAWLGCNALGFLILALLLATA